MCGRYYVDDETAREIEKMVRNLDKKMMIPQQKDICPSQIAAVIREQEQHLAAAEMAWGFPNFNGKGLLINARAESALEKRTFKESILHRRCIIPAKGFYEWNKEKEKYSYERQDSPVIFMAGCFALFEGQDRFVILTTAANPSVAPVHDRMPLILDNNELKDWVLDDRATEYILHKTPILLTAKTNYQQMGLF